MKLELFERAEHRADRVALVAPEGVFTFGNLVEASDRVATRLLAGQDDLEGARVCFLIPPGSDYVVTLWGIWKAGGHAVPLPIFHPPAELAHVLADCEPELIVAHPSLAPRVTDVAAERRLAILLTPALLDDGPVSQLPTPGRERAALMLYTSGTTGRPKGVVITHGNLEAQLASLSEAWEWSERDHILLHLPLHHVHGIVNVLLSSLWNGATCEILPRFSPVDVWERFARGEITLGMAVPTIYRRLIEAWEEADVPTRYAWSSGARACRLMVSGSAALPVKTLERWQEITGHRLLERYGMTEIGMALANPLRGERRAGHVGRPMPGVEVRVVDDNDLPVPEGTAGEIQVRGPTVFREYWRQPEETDRAFTEDGWFRTGDQAQVDDGACRILGRSSVDILKTGGEKISALEIEDVLRLHPSVADCAVVGVPDADWGDRVCAAIVRKPNSSSPDPHALTEFAKARLAPYKVPKDFVILDELPRNAMGKVSKPTVRELFDAGARE